MKFRFIGNGRDDPETIEVFGFVFAKDKPVEVDDDHAIGKLLANSHFKKVLTRVRNKVRSSDKSPATSSGD